LAIDARTGKLRWYFQFTPADTHAWDAASQPILADISWQGETVPALLFANRNAFFYALDRRSGRFLYAKPFAKQTWAKGFTEQGRPILLPGTEPTAGGTVVSPANNGGTSWYPPSFDPRRRLVFVPSVDSADIFFNVDSEKYRDERPYLGSGFIRSNTQPTTLAIRAIDVSSGAIRWDSTIASGGGEMPGEMGGILSTEGDLLFAGHENEFDAFDAETGAKLWAVPLGGVVHAAPISFATGGHQFIAIFSGRTLFAFGLPVEGPPPSMTNLPHSGRQAARP
jgi:alcohol dehydrogenase (cytochrome c)